MGRAIKTFILANPAVRRNAADYIMQVAEDRALVSIKKPAKSRGQEAKYHAQIADISKFVGGELADLEDAKRILISAFRIDSLRDFEDEWREVGDIRMVRGLRGEVVVLGAQSRKFPKKLASAFVEFLYALGAEHGIVWSEPEPL